MAAPRAPVVISYGGGLVATLEPHRALRLSTMVWDFPERSDLIALITVSERLNFLRDHLKSSHADLVKRIEDTKELSKDDEGLLHTAVKDFKKSGAY